ncbi:MAG: DUF11 domain-containing protein, partial [Deltaproteobacteria bacterium]|nr:DUF11 domain-containing protein [Deltaproteobacteria bacterium]MBW2536106.1 DUF11 domain-containing protein [Deltaproteobacteria bacterium]
MTFAALGLVGFCMVPVAVADPVVRVAVDQQGDFALVGNSLAWDCAATGTILTGTVGSCGSNTIDTAPDVYWRSDDDTQTALADVSIAPTDARSSAHLQLTAWGTPTHAFLYWAGEFLTASYPQAFDPVVTLERIDGGWGDVTDTLTVTADSSRVVPQGYHNYFQCSADVTAFVQAYGSGVYRFSDIDVGPLVDRDEQISFAGWFLVVFYEDPYEPLRNLVLFESLDLVASTLTSSATLSGFYVPNTGYDAKLGVVAYEGDLELTGDGLRFGTAPLAAGDELTNTLNPFDNFFNSSRTWLDASPLAAGDLPLLVGDPDSMAGIDMDVLDITSRVTPGQTAADIEAFSNGDVYVLGAYVTSIATFSPSFATSTKTAEDIDGGTLLPGDLLRYTITATNTGNDDAIDVVLADQLPQGVTYQTGSLQIISGPNAGAKTDAVDSDQGEYDGASRTVTVRLGAGADGSSGGTVAMDQSTVVQFIVVVDAGYAGSISNQGGILFAGAQGAPAKITLTDSDTGLAGQQPAEILAEECDGDAECSPPRPKCHTVAEPNVCVECLGDADCSGANSGFVCDPTPACTAGCRGTGADSGCPVGEQCTSVDATIGSCVPQGGGGAGGG